ncbi:MAG: MBL fold metallo-hydrolase [Thermoleophilum sp.]|nr:MBL fold metallo-hydrolase [Thermoleophilum sp.]
MIFRQVMHDDLGCASYLVGDERTGRAAVVDPKFEIDEYLQLARYHGLSIEHILETHNHADHVSGHGRLAAATGATIHIHRLASPDYEHEPFDDGFELSLGDVRIRALHTPGHRPEHTAFLLYDVRRSQQPWALLTGDSLFVGDIARPDLAIEKHEGARGIFRSLRRMLELPEHVEIWPGHIGGSLCGGDTVDRKPVSTLGYERLHNEMLAVTDEDEFVDRATRDLPPQPPNFQAIVALNRGPLLIDGVEARPLTPRQVLLKQHAGALVVDVRTALQFDEAHVPGVGQFDEDHQVRDTVLERRVHGVPDAFERIHLPAPRALVPAELAGAALVTDPFGAELERPTPGAPLHEEAVLSGPLPEWCVHPVG